MSAALQGRAQCIQEEGQDTRNLRHPHRWPVLPCASLHLAASRAHAWLVLMTGGAVTTRHLTLPWFPGAQAHREANGNGSAQTSSSSWGTSHLSDASSPTLSHLSLLYGHRNRLREITSTPARHRQCTSQNCAGTFPPHHMLCTQKQNWSAGLMQLPVYQAHHPSDSCKQTPSSQKSHPYPSDFRGLAYSPSSLYI